jgi:hypothetical protein
MDPPCFIEYKSFLKKRGFMMTLITQQDYKHANERGNGPKCRMEGGDMTDDISINDPNNPFKKKRKKKTVTANAMPQYKKPE